MAMEHEHSLAMLRYYLTATDDALKMVERYPPSPETEQTAASLRERAADIRAGLRLFELSSSDVALRIADLVRVGGERLAESEGREPVPGEVVQLDPAMHEPVRFGGCFLVVTDARAWGVQGYVKNCGASGLIFYRAEKGTYALVGDAPWISSADRVA